MSSIHRLTFEKPIYELEEQLENLEKQEDNSPNIKDAIRSLRVEITQRKREIYDNLNPYETVQVSRHQERPQTADYLELVFDEFVELHGDKNFGDDRAIVTGFAKIDGQKVMFLGQKKGRTVQERTESLYGCANPEGYKKALEKMKMAAKYGLPIICLIDTPGAYPGIEAEERGQAYSIAVNLREMSKLRTPIICVVIGEGGSGGALGIGIGDHIAVLQYAYYSVISPEGCAGILWKDGTLPENQSKAAHALKFTSGDLLQMGIIDEVIKEPLGAAHRDHRKMATELKKCLVQNLKKLATIPLDELVDRRYEKFRKIGVFEEKAGEQSSTENA